MHQLVTTGKLIRVLINYVNVMFSHHIISTTKNDRTDNFYVDFRPDAKAKLPGIPKVSDGLENQLKKNGRQ